MATIFYDRDATDAGLDLVIVELDATLRENHTADAEVTMHPIESGSKPSDHSRQNPKEFSLLVHISNMALSERSTFTEEGSRAKQAYAFFLSLMAQAQLLDVECNLIEYTGCVLTSVSAPQDVDNADSVSIDLQFRQIKIVSTQRVAARPAQLRGYARRQAAAEPTTTPEEGSGEQRAGLAVQLADGLASIFP